MAESLRGMNVSDGECLPPASADWQPGRGEPGLSPRVTFDWLRRHRRQRTQPCTV